MGCGSCGTSKTGSLPTGCKDHGSCKSGGCNRLNVHDWLSLIPVADFSRPFPFVEVSFNHGSRIINPVEFKSFCFLQDFLKKMAIAKAYFEYLIARL